MSVKVSKYNVFHAVCALDDSVQQHGLGDCGPVAVRSVYRFFGVNRPFRYKDFQRAGYRNGALSGVYTNEFIRKESLGLILDIHKIKDKSDFMEKIKSARKNNHPVIICQPGHVYTIIPHEIVSIRSSARFDINTGEKLTKPHFYKCFRFYLNKKRNQTCLNTTYMKKGSRNLVVCFNSRFEGLKDVAYNYRAIDVKFVEIDSVWREFREHGKQEIYEARGVKFNLEDLKTPGYEWGTTKSEYKKRKSYIKEHTKYWYKKYKEKFLMQCDSARFYFNNENVQYATNTAKKCYKLARENLKNLEKDVFSVYGIGEELRRDFNKNLPALIEDVKYGTFELFAKKLLKYSELLNGEDNLQILGTKIKVEKKGEGEFSVSSKETKPDIDTMVCFYKVYAKKADINTVNIKGGSDILMIAKFISELEKYPYPIKSVITDPEILEKLKNESIQKRLTS